MSVGSQREGPGASSHRSQLKSELPLLHITHDSPLSALSHLPSIRKGHQKQEAPASPLVVQSLLSSSETAASPGPSSRAQAHMIWNMTAKVVLIVLQCSGMWATWSPWSTLSTRAPWACVWGIVGEGGRCQWTAVTAKTEKEVQKSRQTLAAG